VPRPNVPNDRPGARLRKGSLRIWVDSPRGGVAHLSEDRLGAEHRLVALARAGGPLRRVMVALAGRLAERKAWERLGYARLSRIRHFHQNLDRYLNGASE
jgi:hypothetical protein